MDANMEAPKDITAYTLVSCCDHIQVACLNRVATNADMRKKLEIGRSALPKPVEIYVRTIKGKISDVEAKNQAPANALMDEFSLIDIVHD